LPRLNYASESMLMSAFPESGRSDRQKLSEIDVRFRPEADARTSDKNEPYIFYFAY